jgi:predicted AAA+ superfamily ATPase
MESTDQQVCILYGPRQAGKTTLLKQLYGDMARGWKKTYFSFDEDIVPRQFVDLEEFLSRMMLKF